jgi:murein L,D-transpeptidase YcbB/YkuD
VQDWEKLAHYVIARDNALSRRGTVVEGIDSLNAWLSRKENHILQLKGRIPLFFTYITAEGKDGKLVLHEDIYGEDQGLRQFYGL